MYAVFVEARRTGKYKKLLVGSNENWNERMHDRRHAAVPLQFPDTYSKLSITSVNAVGVDDAFISVFLMGVPKSIVEVHATRR